VPSQRSLVVYDLKMNKKVPAEWLIVIGIVVFILPIWLPENLGGISWAGIIFVVVGCIYLLKDFGKKRK
jgi:hypothetical protein